MANHPFEDRVRIRRHWKSHDNDIIRCYASIEGTATLGELIVYFGSLAVELNFATATWDDKPTIEELEQRRRNRENHDRRHAEWERTTYERLKLKFEELSKDHPDSGTQR